VRTLVDLVREFLKANIFQVMRVFNIIMQILQANLSQVRLQLTSFPANQALRGEAAL
jgi:hypothetical protein